MLISFLRHVRRKPKAVRNQYALLLAGSFTGLVALVWGFTSLQMPAISVQTTAKETSNAPFSNLVGQLKDQFASVRDSFSTSTEEQSEATVEATSTNAQNMQLSPENIENVRQESATTSEPVATSSQPVYQEVLIATSSKATSTNEVRE